MTNGDDHDSFSVATGEDCCHGNDDSVKAVQSLYSWCRGDGRAGYRELIQAAASDRKGVCYTPVGVSAFGDGSLSSKKSKSLLSARKREKAKER